MNENFIGKFKFKALLVLKSPLLLGSGEDEITDNDIIKDSDGKPYIPATSFIGVLRSEFIERGIGNEIVKFFGFSKDDSGFQSPFYCKDLDLTINNITVTTRDGVRIDNKTGIAEDGAKYDYEILEPGVELNLEMGFDINNTNSKTYRLNSDKAINFINNIYTILKSEGISAGAKTQNGLGKLILIENSAKLLAYDFGNPDHVHQWLNDGEVVEEIPLTFAENFKSKYNFELSGNFSIKNSLIVRSYRTNSKITDAEHIKSKGKPVLPGTSLKGAIRARAEKILNTVNSEITNQIIDNLFGTAGNGDKKIKSRILIEEREIKETERAVQSRVKIDRFTGGAIDGALFDSMPEFPKNDEHNIELIIKIRDCKPNEAGLMLLILKDLMTADLPIGGEKSIGRGILIGNDAIINYAQVFKFNSSGPENNVDLLQTFINELWQTEPEKQEKETKNGK